MNARRALLCALPLLALGLAARGQGAAGLAGLIEPGREKGSISIPSFKRLLAERPDAVHLIDVSSAREFAAGSLRGASNVPINRLEKQVGELPADKPIVFFCATGGRASEAYDTTRLLRPELAVHFLGAQVQVGPDGVPVIR